jgi:predicted RNA-binding protein with PIN domain
VTDDPTPDGPTLVVDGNNVIGSVADGWWRDRPAAARRLLGRLQCLQREEGIPVLLVLDVPQRDLPAGTHDGVEVGYPSRRGRNAADDRIVEILAERALDDAEVVTSDRALRDTIAAAHPAVRLTGARTFLTRLDAAGC